MGNGAAVRLLVISGEEAQSSPLAELLVAQVPGAEVTSNPASWVRAAPEVSGVVIDGRADSQAAADTGRRLRAMGYKGGVAIVVEAGAPLDDAATRFDLLLVPVADVATQLVPELATQMLRLEQLGTEMVMRARRITAAGELALRLQHALNNPLAGLMAEVQLLQMENLPAPHDETLTRMLGLCRRMVEITRSLDGVGERKSTNG
jgi:signal transduction histidine kinase